MWHHVGVCENHASFWIPILNPFNQCLYFARTGKSNTYCRSENPGTLQSQPFATSWNEMPGEPREWTFPDIDMSISLCSMSCRASCSYPRWKEMLMIWTMRTAGKGKGRTVTSPFTDEESWQHPEMASSCFPGSQRKAKGTWWGEGFQDMGLPPLPLQPSILSPHVTFRPCPEQSVWQ